jgi:hypothetical protein
MTKHRSDRGDQQGRTAGQRRARAAVPTTGKQKAASAAGHGAMAAARLIGKPMSIPAAPERLP